MSRTFALPLPPVTLDFDALKPHMSARQLASAERLCPECRSVQLFVFPYYAGDAPGNLSLYCRGTDYHAVVADYLEAEVRRLAAQHPNERFAVGVDSSPIPEKTAARLAGLGMVGLHMMMIVPPFGSYIFLGEILSTLPAPTQNLPEQKQCNRCGACVMACPTQAIELQADGRAKLLREHCISALTQKRGRLTDAEECMLKQSATIFGCDLCQRVCPHNKGLPLTTIPPFREGLLCGLDEADLEPLTEAEFQQRYGRYAFAWRGREVLLRNLRLLGCR